jgi:serine/threonine protein kinase
MGESAELNGCAESVATDDESGDDVEQFAVGDPIVSGYSAWHFLGAGPRCETWMAWSETMRVPVALKIPIHGSADYSLARIALTREVEALRTLAHPAIPRLYDADLSGLVPYMATEFIEGWPLGARLADVGAFTIEETALIGAQTAIVLGYLHDRGFVHHDIKPDNVMLKHGRVVLIDFGFAERSGSEPLPGGPRGTDVYMAPEHRRGDPNTPASDFYSLGLTLLELMSGDIDKGDDTAWAARELASLSARLEPHAWPLVRAIECLIDDDPSRRPADWAGVIALLRPLLSADQLPWPGQVDAIFTSIPLAVAAA